MNGWIWLMPLIGACSGWIIASAAIRLLFRPYTPVKFAGVSFHGLIPSRLEKIADGLSEFAGGDLGYLNEIRQKITSTDSLRVVMPLIETHIDDFLRNKLGKAMPMIGMFIGDKTIAELKGIFMKELEEIFPLVMKNYIEHVEKDFDLREYIRQKIVSIPPARLEFLIYRLLKREIKQAGIAGALTGLLTGGIQLAVTLLLS